MLLLLRPCVPRKTKCRVCNIMSYHSISDVVGHDSDASERLWTIRVRTSEKLLDRAKSPQGRDWLARTSGISENTLLDYANIADLMRVKGIGREHAMLLRAVGVPTLRELRQRNARNLHAEIVKANFVQGYVKFLPSRSLVQRWIERAREIEPVITYR